MPDTEDGRSTRARPTLRWLASPDPVLTDFGSGGARHLTLVRVGLFGVLLVTAVTFHVTMADPLSPITTTMAAAGFLVSLLIAWRVRSGASPRTLPFVATTVDVSLVSGVLISFALSGRPTVAANSMFIWELYLLAIVVSALHFDLRVVGFAGAMAIAQWAGVLGWVTAHWGLPTDIASSRPHIVVVQTLRFVLIGGFTVATALIVLRTVRLMQLSGSDALTGLANRALLDQRLVEEVAAVRRWGRPLSVAFLDIDRFKDFNDRWGHAAGDEALRATARTMIEVCRESDVIARWGGEEFVLVLPDSAAKDAEMVIERIRQRLAVTPVPGVALDARVTLSAGIAAFPTDGESAGELEQAADRRLMEAKRLGRDRVVARG